MKKLLAIVRRTEDGFRGYVPWLPGCEIRAATAEQAEADITAAAKAYLEAGKEGTNGLPPIRSSSRSSSSRRCRPGLVPTAWTKSTTRCAAN